MSFNREQFLYHKEDSGDRELYNYLIKSGQDGHAAKRIIQKEKIEQFIKKLQIQRYCCWAGLILGIIIFRFYTNYYLMWLGGIVSFSCAYGILILTHKDGEVRGYFRGYEESQKGE